MKNTVTENYLSEIYRIEQTGIKVKANILALKMNISNAAVTDKLKKLSEERLVDYEPYKTIELTPKGKSNAISVLRRHRIWEIFLFRIVGLPWDKVHDEAHRLEHSTSDELIDRMEVMLNFPQFDPHGHPIPGKDGRIPQKEESVPLSQLQTGETGEVSSVSDFDDGFLRYLSQIGLKPGDVVTVDDRLSFDDSMVININENHVNISGQSAANIFIAV